MFRKLLLFGVAVCISGLLSAQKIVTVECRIDSTLKMNLENRITLYQVAKGRMVEKATAHYNPQNGYFAFQFVPEYEGFYVIGERMNYFYPIWVKSDDKVSVRLTREGMRLYGKNSHENKILSSFQNLLQDTIGASLRPFLLREMTFQQFFNALERLANQIEDFKSTICTKNDYFNSLMKYYVDCQMDYIALNYIMSPKPVNYVWPKDNELSPYYSTIVSKGKFADENVLKFPEGFRLLNMYMNYAQRFLGDQCPENELELLSSRILQGEMALEYLQRQTSLFSCRKLMRKYAPFLSPEQQREADMIFAQLEKKNASQRAVDFTYPDINGHKISLSDFKGKVVLLDIWATWCGPCRAELPHLKKLEEEMAGTDLVVIGVSTDVQKDYEKWKGMVERGEVVGIQLFSNGGEELRKAYQVDGIPRFIVFDREGKVAESSAPRPSNPELKELLNELLEQK